MSIEGAVSGIRSGGFGCMDCDGAVHVGSCASQLCYGSIRHVVAGSFGWREVRS